MSDQDIIFLAKRISHENEKNLPKKVKLNSSPNNDKLKEKIERQAERDRIKYEQTSKKEKMLREKEELNEKKRQEKKEMELEKERERKERELEKEQEKMLKESERKAREQERELEKMMKDKEREEREKEKIERENFKQFLIEEKIKKQKKVQQAFKSFFISKSLSPNHQKCINEKSTNEQFSSLLIKPFVLKKNMKLAPLKRIIKELPKFDKPYSCEDKCKLYIQEMKQKTYRPQKFPKTLSLSDAYNDYLNKDVSLGRNEKLEGDTSQLTCTNSQSVNEILIIKEIVKPHSTTSPPKIHKVKYLHFHENTRPPYYGTWRVHSQLAKMSKLKDEEILSCENDYFSPESSSPNFESTIISPLINIDPMILNDDCDECYVTSYSFPKSFASIVPEDNVVCIPEDGKAFLDPILDEISYIETNFDKTSNLNTEKLISSSLPSKINVNGRTPFKMMFDSLIDYTYDSDEDWEDEEMGESLHSNDENEEDDCLEELKGSDYDSDEGFIVDHGYLSEEEYGEEELEDIQSHGTELENHELSEPDIESKTSSDLIKAQQKIKLKMWKEKLMKDKADGGYVKLVPKVMGFYWDCNTINNEIENDTKDGIPKSFLQLKIQPLVPIPIDVFLPSQSAILDGEEVEPLNQNSIFEEGQSMATPKSLKKKNLSTVSPQGISNRISLDGKSPNPGNLRPVPPEAMPHLAKIVHGNPKGISKMVKEFQELWERLKADRPMEANGGNNLPSQIRDTLVPLANNGEDTENKETDLKASFSISKRQIEATIKAIAVYSSDCISNSFGKCCWILKPDSLEKYYP